MTSFHVLDLASEQSSFGIRMFAHAARSILRVPISEFGGARVCLEDVWGAEGERVTERLLLAAEVGEMIAFAESRLIDALGRLDAPAPGLVQHGLHYMYDAGGVLSPSALADKLSYSERHLRRFFERELGIPPKEMLGIIRFQSLLGELAATARAAEVSYPELAARYGFYDQSHFIAAFKRYYGMTPTQALRAFRHSQA
jgi:AraC-like DNA-binding protein